MSTDDSSPIWSGTVLAMRGDDVLTSRSAGWTAGSDSEPCRRRSRFQSCSISKLVISTVVLSLIESKTLRLQEPITSWLPDIPPSWQPINLHQLLSNTSGIGHWANIGLPRLMITPPPRSELLALMAAAPLVSEPGAGWSYSGPGFLTAARIVESATGLPYAQVAEKLVFEPASMEATTSGPPTPDGADAARGHDRGRLRPLHPGFAEIPGTGDLWTTVDDLIRLRQALRDGRLLTPEFAAQLHHPHATLTPSTDPSPFTITGYGYGTFLGEVLGYRAQLNPGDNPGYQTLLAYLPDLDVDLAALCNENTPSLNAALADTDLRP